ncbi:MAG: response regulator transcription factor [Syntrophomonadaceae bacterium]|nr:response regulator transcription factor [Syntrophomonadaceae bacterium]
MKILLLEDEEHTREFFIKMLKEITEVKEVMATADGNEAINLALHRKPHLILIDIELDGQDINGLQVAKSLLENDQEVFLVFITGYTKYALESFSVHPYDYILKPVNKNRMQNLIKEISIKIEKFNFKPLIITYADKIYQIDPSEVIFIEKDNNISFIHTDRGVFKTYYTLQELQDLLGSTMFRSHKSYLINSKYIDTIKVNPNRTYQVNFREYKKTAMMSRQGYKEYRNRLSLVR